MNLFSSFLKPQTSNLKPQTSNLKRVIVCLCLVVFVFCCEQEVTTEELIELQEPQQQLKPFVFKRILKEKINKNRRLSIKLKTLGKNLVQDKPKNTSGKKVYNKTYDFVIDTESAIFIEEGDYHSYTFPTKQGRDEYIRNILFTFNERGEYDAFLMEYGYSYNELNTLDNEQLEKRTKIKQLDLSFNSLFSKGESFLFCAFIYSNVPAHQGDLVGGDNERTRLLTGTDCSLIFADDPHSNNGDDVNKTNNNTVLSGPAFNTGGSGVATSPTISLYDDEDIAKFNKLKDELSLSIKEYNCMQDHYQNTMDAYDFLDENSWSNDEKAFAKSAINTKCDGGEVDFKNEILKDSSFVGTKADCVLEALVASRNNLLKKTIEAFTDGNSKFKLKFIAKNDSEDLAPARTGFPTSENIITIRFNLAVANDNTSAMDLASTILHESIHAELHRIKISNNAGPNSLPSSLYNWYIQMWSYYEAINNEEFDDPYKVLNETATDSQHNLMAFRYITPIASGLREFDDNSHPIDNYKDFAWQGLTYYVKQNGYISQNEIDMFTGLKSTVTNDSHKSPCD